MLQLRTVTNPVDVKALAKEMDAELKELEDTYTVKKEALDKMHRVLC